MAIQSVLYQLGAINNDHCFFVLLDKIALFCTFSNPSLLKAAIASWLYCLGLNIVWKSYGHVCCEFPFHIVHFPPTLCLICSRLRIATHHFPQPHPPASVGPNLRRFHAKWDMKCSASAPGALFFLSYCLLWNQKMASGLESRCLCLLFPRLQPEHLCKQLRHRKLSWWHAERGIKACSRQCSSFSSRVLVTAD